MSFLHSLLAPHSLEISNVPEKWSEWKETWEHYSVASKMNKEGDIQVADSGHEARKVYQLPSTKILRVSLSDLTIIITLI